MVKLSQRMLMAAGCLLLGACAATTPGTPAPGTPPTPPRGPSPVEPAATDVASVIASLKTARCGRGELGDKLDGIAAGIERQKLLYDTKNLTDCSGIFHRAMDQFRVQCPGPAYPPLASRDTRAIAKWYADNRQIVWVDKPLSLDHLIRPGSVMFFGNGGVKYSAAQLGTAMMYKKGEGIDHVGIVTRVKIVDGHVEQYWMLHGHGRKGRTAAGVTSTTYTDHTGQQRWNNQHRAYVSRREGSMTPYGNWNEQWVAVAPVLEPTKLAHTSPARGGIRLAATSTAAFPSGSARRPSADRD
jgi:hypothetical protein